MSLSVFFGIDLSDRFILLTYALTNCEIAAAACGGVACTCIQ